MNLMTVFYSSFMIVRIHISSTYAALYLSKFLNSARDELGDTEKMR